MIPPSCDAAAAAADAVVELGGIPGLLAAALTVLTTFETLYNERLYWSKLRDPGKDTACSRYKIMIQAEGDRRP